MPADETLEKLKGARTVRLADGFFAEDSSLDGLCPYDSVQICLSSSNTSDSSVALRLKRAVYHRLRTIDLLCEDGLINMGRNAVVQLQQQAAHLELQEDLKTLSTRQRAFQALKAISCDSDVMKRLLAPFSYDKLTQPGPSPRLCIEDFTKVLCNAAVNDDVYAGDAEMACLRRMCSLYRLDLVILTMPEEAEWRAGDLTTFDLGINAQGVSFERPFIILLHIHNVEAQEEEGSRKRKLSQADIVEHYMPIGYLHQEDGSKQFVFNVGSRDYGHILEGLLAEFDVVEPPQ